MAGRSGRAVHARRLAADADPSVSRASADSKVDTVDASRVSPVSARSKVARAGRGSGNTRRSETSSRRRPTRLEQVREARQAARLRIPWMPSPHGVGREDEVVVGIAQLAGDEPSGSSVRGNGPSGSKFRRSVASDRLQSSRRRQSSPNASAPAREARGRRAFAARRAPTGPTSPARRSARSRHPGALLHHRPAPVDRAWCSGTPARRGG